MMCNLVHKARLLDSAKRGHGNTIFVSLLRDITFVNDVDTILLKSEDTNRDPELLRTADKI